MRLKEDLAILKPTFLPSVPRLFNRFYDGMQSKIKELKGVKRYLANKAVNVKIKNLENSGTVTHAVYDKLVFNKFKDVVGGRVKKMVTGSAPISKDILNFLKIAFCCPIYEGYG